MHVCIVHISFLSVDIESFFAPCPSFLLSPLFHDHNEGLGHAEISTVSPWCVFNMENIATGERERTHHSFHWQVGTWPNMQVLKHWTNHFYSIWNDIDVRLFTTWSEVWPWHHTVHVHVTVGQLFTKLLKVQLYLYCRDPNSTGIVVQRISVGFESLCWVHFHTKSHLNVYLQVSYTRFHIEASASRRFEHNWNSL